MFEQTATMKDICICNMYTFMRRKGGLVFRVQVLQHLVGAVLTASDDPAGD